MSRPADRWRRDMAVLLLSLACTAGCNITAGQVSSPRTPIEQLLLTQSLFRSLEEMVIPLRSGDVVTVETAWVPSHDDFKGDLPFAASVIASWFTRHGAIVGGEHPKFHARVLLHAFGLDKKDVFIGVPPIQSVLIPVALPELTLYRNLRNRGYTRLSIDVVDISSGRLVGTPWTTEGSVLHERYTVLFLFSWTASDLLPPPP
ncbi:MAG TPA: hypothetical protein VFQ02_05240 [Nitrospira sp.]|nr:hypothetical protein [Nitrospira sp.]